MKRPLLCSVASAALLVTSLPLVYAPLALPLHAASAPNFQATVVRFENRLDIKSAGSSKWTRATVQDHLKGGDYASTDARSTATLLFRDGMRLDMNHNTDVIIRNTTDVHISSGELYEHVPPGKGKRNVNTGNAVASVEGTKFDVQVVGNKTILTVVEHTVRFHNTRGSVLVKQNQQSVVVGAAAPSKPVAVDASKVVRWAASAGYSPQLAFPPYYPTATRRQAAAAQARRDLQAGHQSTQTYLTLANASADANQLSDAMVNYRKALTGSPPALAALTGLAQALLRSGQTAAAGKLYNQAHILYPSAAEPLLGQGHVALLGNDPDTAVKLYTGAARLAPADPYIPLSLGQAQIALGSYAEAVVQEQRALKLAPSLAPAAVALGDVYALMGDASSAVTAYHRALQADARSWVAWNDLGVTLNLLGRGNEAIATLKKAVAYAQTPYEQGLSLAFLASQLTYQGKASQALPYALQATHVDPGNAQAFYALGDLYAYGLSDYVRAEAALRQALHLAPLSASAWATLGEVYARTGKYSQAIAAVQKAIAVAPTYVYPRTLLGDIYTTMGDNNRAVAAFKAAVRAVPGAPEAWAEYGVGLHNAGDDKAALAALRHSIGLLPDNSPSSATAYGYLAATYANLGDPANIARGISVGQTGVRLNPTDDIALANLGFAYVYNGQYKEAVALLKRALAVAPRESGYWQYLADAYNFMVQAKPSLSNERNLELDAAQHAVAADPLDSGAWYTLGKARQDVFSSIDPQAQAAYQRSIALDKKNPAPLLELGRIDIAQGHFPEAVSALKQALHLNSQDPGSWLYLGIAYYDVGNSARQVSNYTNALAALAHADPREPDTQKFTLLAYQQIVTIYLLHSDYADAARWSTRLVKIDAAQGYFELGYTYQTMGGHKAQAMSYYQKALAAAQQARNTDLIAQTKAQLDQLARTK